MKNIILCSVAFLVVSIGCAPRITNIVPNAAMPGTRVVIHGEGLTTGTDNPTSVDFNGEGATFTAVGDNVEADVPLRATIGPVHVTRSYVDLLHPSGTATSPNDFVVVVSETRESEGNDVMGEADPVSDNGIVGTLTDISDIDWFQVPTGDLGPYGYTIELYAYTEGTPDGMDVRVSVCDNEGGTLQNLYTNDPSRDLNMAWTAQPPDTNIYLEVTCRGSTSHWIPITYHITIAKVPINDSNEMDNNCPEAREITPGIAHVNSYLCSLDVPAHSSHLMDCYRFELAAPARVFISIVDAGLPTSGSEPELDVVHLYLLDNTCTEPGSGGYSNVGNSNIAALSATAGAGIWYIWVTNSFNTIHTSGNGSAPLCFKRPYRIYLSID